MCGKINEDDFYTLYHEMGHLYYYLAYRHQPYLFQVSGQPIMDHLFLVLMNINNYLTIYDIF